MILRAKKEFYEREVKKLTGNGANKISHKALRNVKGCERPKIWSVHDLGPGKTAIALAEELADHYSKITKEFIPLDRKKIPKSYDREIPVVSAADVGVRMGKMKKPTSYVTIDVPGLIVNRMTSEWALYVTNGTNNKRCEEGRRLAEHMEAGRGCNVAEEWTPY